MAVGKKGGWDRVRDPKTGQWLTDKTPEELRDQRIERDKRREARLHVEVLRARKRARRGRPRPKAKSSNYYNVRDLIGLFEDGESVESGIPAALKIREEAELRTKIVPPSLDGGEVKEVSLLSIDSIKASYVAEGLSVDQISDKFNIPKPTVEALIKEGKLVELRGIFVRDGLAKLQNKQIKHAQDLLELENNFNKLTVQALKVKLRDKMTYLSYHGDLYRRDKDGEIIKDKDGIPIQVPIPNVGREIRDLKTSLVIGEGLKRLMDQVQLVLEGAETSKDDIDVGDIFLEAQDK